MKSKNFIIALTLLSVVSCKSPEIWMTKAITYDLKGNVKFFSTKEFSATYDENRNLILDTKIPYFFIINRTFDKNGNLHFIEYFNKDSLLLSRIEYYKDGSSTQFDKDGSKKNITKIVSAKDDILCVESYDPKFKNMLSKATTKHNNGHISWQKSITLKDSTYLEYVYYRDSGGLDTLYKILSTWGNNQDSTFITVKYLSLDKKGNWIKRIDHSLTDTNVYIVKERKIEYYD